MTNYRGRVNGIDAQATKGLEPRCQAFINKENKTYIQVTTKHQSLQSALELACLKDLEVVVTFEDIDVEKTLTRVQIIDR